MSEYRDELEAAGINPDAVAGMVNEHLQSLSRGLGAAQRLTQSPHAPAINRLLSDPTVAERVNAMWAANPEAASEYLEMKAKFEAQGRPPIPSGGGYGPQTSARMLPISGPIDASLDVYGSRRPTVEEARAVYQANPNKDTARLYAKARLDTVLTDEFLNQ